MEHDSRFATGSVLSDIMMPGMNGLELCERIKQDVRTSHIPVVLLSAKTTLQDYFIGYKFHADAYCPKPFDNKIMKELLNSIITNRKRILQHKKVPAIKISEVSTTSTDDKFLRETCKDNRGQHYRLFVPDRGYM
mgnify:CR=1 FL=1